jgi:hypothetical protein
LQSNSSRIFGTKFSPGTFSARFVIDKHRMVSCYTLFKW